MPSQIIIDPSPNQSWWAISQSYNILQFLQTFSHLLHVLRVNLPEYTYEMHRALVVDLPILVFYGKNQVGPLDAELWALGPVDYIRPLGHCHEVCFWLFGQKHS